jgi:hypothetical protein
MKDIEHDENWADEQGAVAAEDRRPAAMPCSATKVSLLDMFKDHYWDSLEKDRDIVIAHISAVLDMYDFGDAE